MNLLRLVVLRRAVAWWSLLRRNYWVLLAALLCFVAFVLPPHLIEKGHHPPVGTYIAIMGCLAAAVTFRKEPRLVEKAAWILVVTGLMFAEIKNLYVDRDEHNAQQSLISQNLAAQGQTLSGIARNIQLSFASDRPSRTLATEAHRTTSRHHESVGQPEQPVVVNVGPAYGNLRERTIQLSQGLYSLLARQQQEQQAMFGGADAAHAQAIAHEMVIRLSWEYFAYFDSQVRQIRDDFAKLNLRDNDLESIMRSIDELDALNAKTNRQADWKVNGAMVTTIARGLTELASKLPSS